MKASDILDNQARPLLYGRAWLSFPTRTIAHNTTRAARIPEPNNSVHNSYRAGADRNECVPPPPLGGWWPERPRRSRWSSSPPGRRWLPTGLAADLEAALIDRPRVIGSTARCRFGCRLWRSGGKRQENTPGQLRVVVEERGDCRHIEAQGRGDAPVGHRQRRVGTQNLPEPNGLPPSYFPPRRTTAVRNLLLPRSAYRWRWEAESDCCCRATPMPYPSTVVRAVRRFLVGRAVPTGSTSRSGVLIRWPLGMVLASRVTQPAAPHPARLPRNAGSAVDSSSSARSAVIAISFSALCAVRPKR